MATNHNITATGRKDEGKGASRRLRRSGQVPAIVYGAHHEPQSVQVEHNHLWLASQNEWFYSAILDMDVDGKVQKVLLRDMQRHPYKAQIMHVDFQRVASESELGKGAAAKGEVRARSGEGPTLIESMVYRRSAHGNIIAPPGVPLHFPEHEAIENGEIYSAANDREQAAQVFKVAAQIVRAAATISGAGTPVISAATSGR